jgi:hypothetical protein
MRWEQLVKHNHASVVIDPELKAAYGGAPNV